MQTQPQGSRFASSPAYSALSSSQRCHEHPNISSTAGSCKAQPLLRGAVGTALPAFPFALNTADEHAPPHRPPPSPAELQQQTTAQPPSTAAQQCTQTGVTTRRLFPTSMSPTQNHRITE